MSRAGPAMLVAVAALLAALIGLELRPGSPEEEAMTAPPARAAASESVPAPAPAPVAAAGLRQNWVDTILARPLFSPDRRPAAPRVAGPGAPPARLPRLAGILLQGGRRSVIFAGEGRPVVAAEGAEVNGFRVQAIEAGQVTVLGPDGPVVLRPSFDPRPPAPAATPSAPGLPGLPSLQSLTGIPGLTTPAPAR